MDALAAALGSVRVTGAIFFDAICRTPWGFAVPAMESVAHVLSPGSERLIGYHLVAEGRAVVSRKGAQDVPVAAGDIVIFPHGDPHAVSNGAPARLIDSGKLLGSLLTGELGTDLAEPETSATLRRVVRGGSLGDAEINIRVAKRSAVEASDLLSAPDSRAYIGEFSPRIGFRCAAGQ